MANRFAALAPDFEEEEAKKIKEKESKAKKEAVKAKKDEQNQEKAQTLTEVKGFEVAEGAAPAVRGHFRGARRGTRGEFRGGRGGYPRGGEAYRVKESRLEGGDYHFSGSNDPVHPYDRHSGTGRGTEIAKRGSGRRNWGVPEDDIKNQDVFKEETHEEPKPEDKPKEEVPKTEEKKEAENVPAKPLSKREKKLHKKGMKEEETKEESLDADGTALTYKEYQAKLAEKVLAAKQAEVKVQVDPKKVEGLVSYAKPQFKPTEIAPKTEKKEEVEETEGGKKDVLGTFIGFERKERRAPAGKFREGETAPKERTYHERKEEEKPKDTFVLKDEDFPTFK
jgi:hypothetical protein